METKDKNIGTDTEQVTAQFQNLNLEDNHPISLYATQGVKREGSSSVSDMCDGNALLPGKRRKMSLPVDSGKSVTNNTSKGHLTTPQSISQ